MYLHDAVASGFRVWAAQFRDLKRIVINCQVFRTNQGILFGNRSQQSKNNPNKENTGHCPIAKGPPNCCDRWKLYFDLICQRFLANN